MTDPTTRRVAEALAAASARSPTVAHPRFPAVMAHVALDGNAFLLAARRDHAPLTDLRLRRDLSSRTMLELNVDALVRQQTGLRSALIEILTDSPHLDLVCHTLLARLRRTSSVRPDRPRPFTSDLSEYVAMLKYVNAFGSWEDALDVAQAVYASRRPDADSHAESMTYALAATVLGLCDEATFSDDLFTRALTTMTDPIEMTFAGLRWASLQAKRQGQLDGAERVIERLEHELTTSPATDMDKALGYGMLENFRGLIAIRRRRAPTAEDSVMRAIGYFELANRHRTDSDRIGTEEARRYEWMARLNLIQLDIFAQTFDRAIERLSALIDFSRAEDPGSLHTSLSTLGYVRLQNGEPAAALEPLLESHELLRAEYDPSVIHQVRKMLVRCYVELGRHGDAEHVAALPDHFWQATEMPGV